MPGSRLNDTERQLGQWWQNSQNFEYPILQSLSVEGNPGLRGIQKLEIEFNYPITVVCGRNGCGKTTILALASLGFHAPPNHLPFNARRSQKKGENFSYYTFSDFFFKGPNDPDITGVKIKWIYKGIEKQKYLEIQKQSTKWMRYERRPQRPVHYFGLSRCIPAIENITLRSHFGNSSKKNKTNSLDDDFCRRLSDIMGRNYSSAEIMLSSRYSVRAYEDSNTSSSSFNMGAGEDILIDLLYLLQQSPKGSLIVIEEIEIGLHPEALIRLAKHLTEICWEKKFQIIVSTHSSYFIDSLPREARILIQKAKTEHIITKSPTTRLAIGFMSGQLEPELHIYCEDHFAALLIENSLSGEARKRTRIIPVGAKSQLVKQSNFHLLANFGQHILILWDGDVQNGEADKWLKNDLCKNFNHRVNWGFLPGNEPPEQWVINRLDCAEGHQTFATELREHPALAAEIIQQLKTLHDPKEIVRKLATITNIDVDEAYRLQVRAISRLPSNPLKAISEAIEKVLQGQQITRLRP